MEMRGTVKWFDVRRGYGFITDEEGMDYFVHYSEIQGEGFKKLRDGQEVSFMPGEDERGRCLARMVSVVRSSGAEGEAAGYGSGQDTKAADPEMADQADGLEESEAGKAKSARTGRRKEKSEDMEVGEETA